MVTPADQTRVEAEAASWLARLQSSRKSPHTDNAFRAWLSENEAHRQAFERATEIWDILPSVAGDYRESSEEVRRARFQPGAVSQSTKSVAMAASVAVALVAGATWWETRPPVYETRVGEQQVVQLADHSEVALNTNSELKVKYSKAERRVILERGEALFDVSHDISRPFLVVAGDDIVRAVGTRFVVRRDGAETRITLLQGKVQVLGPSGVRQAPLAALEPGQRLTVTPDAGAELDRPASLDAVTAWRRGEIVFDNSTLIDAAEELNRYSNIHLIIADPSIASLKVSGVFSTRDVPEAAKAFASLYGLTVERDGTDYKLKSG